MHLRHRKADKEPKMEWEHLGKTTLEKYKRCCCHVGVFPDFSLSRDETKTPLPAEVSGLENISTMWSSNLSVPSANLRWFGA